MLSKELRKVLDKQFGEGVIVSGREAVALQYERVPTGSLQFDLVLGGGIPLGRVIEFAGPESHGKTTLLLKIIAENQKHGRTCAFVDTEGSFDASYASLCGVNLDDLLLNKPTSLEEMIDLTEVLVASREVALIVIDSITGPVPLFVQGRSAEEQTIGVEAKLNNLFCRKVVTAMAPGDLRKEENKPWCSVLYTNQLRQGIGPYAIDEPGGGMGLKFFKSISIIIRRAAWLDEKGDAVTATNTPKFGQTIAFVVKKNKTARPHGIGEVDFYFKASKVCPAGQFDLMKDIVSTSIQLGLIDQRGAYFYIGDYSFQGKKQLVAALKNNREVYEFLQSRLRDQVPFQYFHIERRAREVLDEGAKMDAPGDGEETNSPAE